MSDANTPKAPAITIESSGSPKLPPVVLLTLIALVVRFIYLATLANRPGFAIPIVDEIMYDRMARSFADGQGLADGPFFWPPFWPTVLGIIYAVAKPVFPLARLINIFFGTGSIIVAYFIGKRLFSQRIAFIAGLILSFYGLFVHLNASGLATSLFTLLFLSATWSTLVTKEKPVFWRYLLAGALWGLAAIARPIALLPGVVSALYLILPLRNLLTKQALITIALFFIGLFATISPVTLRNLTNGDSTLIASNGGINFYFGNNASSTGFQAWHPDLGVFWTPETAHIWIEKKVGRSLSPSQASAAYFREGLNFMILNPGKSMVLLGRKFLVTFGAKEISNNGDLNFLKRNNVILKFLMYLGFGILFPVSVIGMIHKWKENTSYKFLIILIFSHLMVFVLFFTVARYRVPVVPLLALFAAFAFTESPLVQWSNNKRSFLQSAAILIVLLVLVHLNLGRVPAGGNDAYAYMLQAQVLQQEGNPDDAIIALENALELEPSIPLANLYLGQIKLDRGDIEDAVDHYSRELDIHPDSRAYIGLGLAYRQLDQRDKAEETFRTGLQILPTNKEIKALLAQEIGEKGIKQADAGDYQKAYETFNQARILDPSNPFFRFAIASCVWSMGEVEKAESMIDDILHVYADFVPAIEWRENGWRPTDDKTGDQSFLVLPGE